MNEGKRTKYFNLPRLLLSLCLTRNDMIRKAAIYYSLSHSLHANGDLVRHRRRRHGRPPRTRNSNFALERDGDNPLCGNQQKISAHRPRSAPSEGNGARVRPFKRALRGRGESASDLLIHLRSLRRPSSIRDILFLLVNFLNLSSEKKGIPPKLGHLNCNICNLT